QGRRLLAVGGGGGKRDVGQRAPGGELKTSAVEVEWHVKARARAGEVFIQLLGGPAQNRMVGIASRARTDAGALWRKLGPEHGPKAAVGRDQREQADGRWMGGAVQHPFRLGHEASFGVGVSVAHS